jgi:hypothetical protein
MPRPGGQYLMSASLGNRAVAYSKEHQKLSITHDFIGLHYSDNYLTMARQIRGIATAFKSTKAFGNRE